ncbi:MAG: GTPase Era [Candidatus Jidaibacter sp.]|nr:GTPase Era [Candidatus Jidaibacter sp.]
MNYETKLLSVAIVGEPNAGKSTLLNTLIGENISIVTHKVQTTRENIRGICTLDKTQIVFIDTPGIFSASRVLEKAIVSNALSAFDDADIICLIIDVHKLKGKTYLDIIQKLKGTKRPVYAIINKVDMVAKETLLPMIGELSELGVFEEIFPISALKDIGVDHFKKFLMSKAVPSDWMFAEDEITDKPIRFIAEEITREQAFFLLHAELPYSLKVETEKWEETEDSVKIYQCIFVNKQSQKVIALGTKGSKIKAIGQRSRKKISELLGKPVHLFLYIKVREDWIEREFSEHA